MESFFDEKFFSRILLSVGVQRTDHGKEFLFFGETFFSLNFVFLEIIWFVWYHSALGVHTNDGWNKKKFLKKSLSKCSFSKEFWITLLSARVQRANAYKRKTVFRVTFFGYRELVVWKTYFECFGKNYQWGTQGWCGSNWQL